MQNPDRAEDLFMDIFEEALEFTIIDQNISKRQERYGRLIGIFYKKRKHEHLLNILVEAIDIYVNETYFLEWFAKIYIDMPDYVEMKVKNTSKYIQDLIKRNSLSKVGLMAQAIIFYRARNFQNARDSALAVYKIEPKWHKCINLLYDIFINLGAFSTAECLYNQNSEVIPIDIRIVRCLVYQNDVDKSMKGIDHCKYLLIKEQEPTKQIEILILLTKAFLSCEEFDRADKTIKKLESLNCASDITSTLKFLKSSQSKSLLTNEHFSTNDVLLMDSMLVLEIGLTFLKLKDTKTAILYILKAAKMDNSNSEIFYWLGKAYNELGDKDRCIKCLKKSIEIDFENSKAVQLLSAIYLKQKDLEQNNELLQRAIQYTYISSTKRAYFQLGLNYLAKKEYNDAVNALRSALRFKNPELLFYSSLGDAYQARGSYRSALNMYEKAMKMNITCPEDATYIRYQICCIYRTLQKFKEALSGFEKLLNENCNYAPALVGIAETFYHLAIFYAEQHRYTRARQNAQKSLNYCTKLLKLKCDFVYVWKLCADIFNFVWKLNNQNRFLQLPEEFQGSTKEKDCNLMHLSVKCLSKAISLCPNDHILWRQLSKTYLSCTNSYVKNIKIIRHLITLAHRSAKYAIQLEPKSWENWNLLGVISILQPEKNLALSQHCFIQALNIEKRSEVSWSNLALLYLSQGNIKLANNAFGKCQQINEKFVNAWVGQAVIAEKIGDIDEAVDLYRHSTELGFSRQSAFGYTNSICSILNESSNLKSVLPKYSYLMNNMNAVVLAIDQINWFNDCVEAESHYLTNTQSFCFLAHLCVEKELYINAVKAYTAALKFADLDNKQQDNILCDLAFVYIKLQKFHLAIETFKKMSRSQLKSTVGMALSYFKSHDYDTSYNIYGNALESFSNDVQKSSILTAMSSILYLHQGETDAKTLLFQSFCEKNLSAFFSSCSMGLLHGDFQLAKLAINQMKKYEYDPQFGNDIVFVTTQYLLLTSSTKKAINYVSTMIHCFPDRSEWRRILSNIMISSGEKSYDVSVARLTSSNILLDKSYSAVNTAQLLALASISISKTDLRKSKIYAQKAIFLNPVCKEAWIAFHRFY
ncbi:superkiller complex protein 3 isoform X2 [Culicoides brevitarsis]